MSLPILFVDLDIAMFAGDLQKLALIFMSLPFIKHQLGIATEVLIKTVKFEILKIAQFLFVLKSCFDEILLAIRAFIIFVL